MKVKIFLIIMLATIILSSTASGYLYCQETDDGADYDQAGITAYGDPPPDNLEVPDSCSGTYLYEYSCEMDSSGIWSVNTETINCVDQGYTTCENGACTGLVEEPEETCDDGIKNQDETDIDCGGFACERCGLGKACEDSMDCLVTSDLITLCTDGICVEFVDTVPEEPDDTPDETEDIGLDDLVTDPILDVDIETPVDEPTDEDESGEPQTVTVDESEREVVVAEPEEREFIDVTQMEEDEPVTAEIDEAELLEPAEQGFISRLISVLRGIFTGDAPADEPLERADEDEAIHQIGCESTDSDNDPFVKGTTTGYPSYVLSLEEDYSADEIVRLTDDCGQEGSLMDNVIEYYCTENDKVWFEVDICLSGCSDGACLRSGDALDEAMDENQESTMSRDELEESQAEQDNLDDMGDYLGDALEEDAEMDAPEGFFSSVADFFQDLFSGPSGEDLEATLDDDFVLESTGIIYLKGAASNWVRGLNLDTGETFEISNGYEKKFSPNMQKVLSYSGGHIYIADALGGETQYFIRGGQSPAWSPNSQEFIYSNKNDLYVIDADAADQSEARLIATLDGMPEHSTVWDKFWTERSMIFYLKTVNEGQTDIYTINSNGQAEREIAVNVLSFKMSPREDEIAYTRYVDGATLLYTSRTDGSNEAFLGQVYGKSFEWSPNNDKLYVVRKEDPQNIHSRNLLYIINDDGTNEIFIDRMSDYINEPASASWSPNGQHLAFGSFDEEGDAQAFVVNSDGSGLRMLTHSHDRAKYPIWSPDNNNIAYFDHFESKVRIRYADSNGEYREYESYDMGRFGGNHKPIIWTERLL